MTEHNVAQPVELRREGAVAHLQICRPQAQNTIDVATARALLEASLECASDGAVRAVLIASDGANFCCGGDLKSFVSQPGPLPAHLREVTAFLHAAQVVLSRMDAPIVAAVQGNAAGAGLSIAAASDLVVAAESAQFVFAYNALGLSPDGGASWSLPRLVGPRRAFELAVTNRRLSAREAYDWGLVSWVVPDAELRDEALAIVERLAAGPTRAFGATKRLLGAAWRTSFEEQLAAEATAITELAASADGVEGVAAFVEKRAARFSGDHDVSGAAASSGQGP